MSPEPPADSVIIDVRETGPTKRPPVGPRELEPYLVGEMLRTEPGIMQARRLQAQVYLERGFVTQDEVSDDGTLSPRVDPWVNRSTYFGVHRGGRLVATARQIETDDVRSLPAIRRADADLAHTRSVLECSSREVVEISGLARSAGSTRHDALALYVSMWRHSMAVGHQVWVMAVDPPFYLQLRKMICGNAIRPMGPLREYMGFRLVMAAMFLDETSREHRRLASEHSERWPVCAVLPHVFSPRTDLAVSQVG